MLPLSRSAALAIGKPVAKVIALDQRPDSYASDIGWTEKRYELGDGNWVYVSPGAPQCEIHFEVNPQGIVVGFRLLGSRCSLY